MVEAPDAPPQLSVVLPAFNEASILEQSIAQISEGLRKRNMSFEVLVVENGSNDETLDVARRLARENPELIVDSMSQADYGAALRRGLLQARGRIVVNFDVDYYDLDFLDAAAKEVLGENRAAVVVGSKRAPGSDDRRALPRRLVTAGFSTILRVGYGLKVSDTHGMKVLDRLAVADLARACVLTRDLFDTELILRIERAGLRSAEIPVAVEELRPARTSILRRVPRTVFGLFRLRSALRGSRA